MIRFRLLTLLIGLLVITTAAVRAADDEVAYTFTHTDANATSVGVAGEFSNWKVLPMTKGDDGQWTRTLHLKPGTYAYKFVINETDWIYDPKNTARKTVNDIENSVVAVGGAELPAATTSGTVSVNFSYADPAAKTVAVAGEFNAWNTTANPLQKDDAGNWKASLALKPGRYQYKFVVDGNWKIDPANPDTTEDGLGGKNSVKVVKP